MRDVVKAERRVVDEKSLETDHHLFCKCSLGVSVSHTELALSEQICTPDMITFGCSTSSSNPLFAILKTWDLSSILGRSSGCRVSISKSPQMLPTQTWVIMLMLHNRTNRMCFYRLNSESTLCHNPPFSHPVSRYWIIPPPHQGQRTIYKAFSPLTLSSWHAALS